MRDQVGTGPRAPADIFSAQRVFAMVLRYTYLIRSSWPRLLELAYWPTVQMILWGFLTQFLAQSSNYVAQALGVLISAVLLWDILFRSQLGVSLSFFEEMWSRNLGHLFVSPLRPSELMVALFATSFCRTVIGALPATLLAIAFFGFSVYSLGFALVGFFLNLVVMGWAFGLAVSGIVLRWGLGAESLAWALIFAIAPVCAIYYPVAVLPEWLQTVSALLPASHVFEGMRAILVEGRFLPELMLKAIGLNVIYLGLGVSIFLGFFRSARKHGLLHQVGE